MGEKFLDIVMLRDILLLKSCLGHDHYLAFRCSSGKAQVTYGSYLSENCLDTVWYLVSISHCLTLVFCKILVRI